MDTGTGVGAAGPPWPGPADNTPEFHGHGWPHPAWERETADSCQGLVCKGEHWKGRSWGQRPSSQAPRILGSQELPSEQSLDLAASRMGLQHTSRGRRSRQGWGARATATCEEICKNKNSLPPPQLTPK